LIFFLILFIRASFYKKDLIYTGVGNLYRGRSKDKKNPVSLILRGLIN